MLPKNRPTDIAILREAGVMQITWADEHLSAYPLRWLRANCPCATCKEVRRQRSAANDSLSLDLTINLDTKPEPSTQIAGAELVGNYAIRLEWTDGHATGIYGFSTLRAASSLEMLKADGTPLLNFEFIAT
ncbi:MAG: DUF971 domain-containing protein [Caldilineaceae bacterium]|nr:DUF971 domain-containing protein [Caldilineaceae bacterium]